MNPGNLKNGLAFILKKLKELSGKLREPWWKYLKLLLKYFETSETIFLLLFANIIGIGAGFGAIAFRWLIGFFHNMFFVRGEQALSFMGYYYVVIIPAIGGVIVGLLIYFFSSESKGHGVPEVMLSVAAAGSRIRPRVAAMKALISSICTGSGGSVGREGPIVQISSALGSSQGQLFRFSVDKRRILIADCRYWMSETGLWVSLLNRILIKHWSVAGRKWRFQK